MKVTVCELHDTQSALARDWEQLTAHVRMEKSDLVLLPEMPFYSWFPLSREFRAEIWRAAVAAHDAWEVRLGELAPAVSLGTRPMDFGNVRYSTGFVWDQGEEEIATVHVKTRLRAEEGAWESTWYDKAAQEFVPAEIGEARVGMLIGSELWELEQARVYGEDGVHILAVPRVGGEDVEMWIAAGRTAAMTSGAYCISSSRATGAVSSSPGPGWIISPEGAVLARTSEGRAFASADIDLSAADKAKETYPRYVIFDVSMHRPASPARPDVQAGFSSD